jgi:hypothetical protein
VSSERRALVLLLAFPLAFPALLPVFLPVLSPVLLAFFPPLLPANQRRTTAPHMEGCPSWESFSPIALTRPCKLA